MKSVSIKQKTKINNYNERVIRLLQTSPRKLDQTECHFHTQFTISLLNEKHLEKYSVMTIQVNEPKIQEEEDQEVKLSYKERALNSVKLFNAKPKKALTHKTEFFSFVR